MNALRSSVSLKSRKWPLLTAGMGNIYVMFSVLTNLL